MSHVFNKIGEEGGTGAAWKGGIGRSRVGERYTHVNKCKNDFKKKGERKKKT
jgi:hypothetical protein